MAAPSPLVIDRYWSWEAKRLQNASLSGLVGQFSGLPDVVALHAGLPPPASFPLSAIHLDLVSQPSTAAAEPETKPSHHHGDDVQPPAGASVPSTSAAHQQHVSITSTNAVVAAQQYCFGPGYPPLLDWVNSTMLKEHAPPVACTSALTSGAVHALSLATSLLCNPGDWMVMDEFTYSHVLEVVFIPKGVRPLPVRMDEHGMDPQHLVQQLQWASLQLSNASSGAQAPAAVCDDDSVPPPSRPPQVVYFIPTGHNPTGITMPVQRKQQLYQVCREHGLLILEDDAYWFLQWGDAPPTTLDTQQPARAEDSGSTAPSKCSTVNRSFLSMDVDGRVLRVDTLAKVLGPGYRLGWVTGNPTLVAKLALAAQASCVGVCPLSQVCVHELLQHWGPQGWRAHLQHLHGLYRCKAQALERAVAKHLAGMVRWRGVPGAGMFMWLEVLGQDGHPPPTGDQLAAALLDARVVVVPGAMSWADMAAVKEKRPCPFLRLTFAFLDEQQLDEGVGRLASALRRAHHHQASCLTA